MSDASKFKFKEINCPVCDSDRSRFLGWRGGEAHQNGAGVKTSIVRCQNCTHQYPNPMPFPSVDLSEIYIDADEYFRNHDVEQKKTDGLDLMRDFEKRLGCKGRFLDVGCGAGEVLWAAKESGWDAVGIDPSKEFIEIGKERLGVEGRVTSLEDAGYADNSFDAVVMGGIIEHLYDPVGTLREVRRVLRPGGLFYFDAPNEDGLYMSIGNLYMRVRGRDWVVVTAPTFPPYHVQGFNRHSLATLLDKTGFKLLDLTVGGGVCEQVGAASLRKTLEFAVARMANAIGKALGRGSYMSIWAQKPSEQQ
jgi:SAM-dependent methyltransferase